MEFSLPENNVRDNKLRMPLPIDYATLAKLPVGRPVDRLAYISNLCNNQSVLDIGCFDETALNKRDTQHWLHGRIVKQARRVVGIDSSTLIPADGLPTGPNSIIYKGDGVEFDADSLSGDVDIVVAGEFIEHIENPSRFFNNIKRNFPGRTLVISTPNGGCFANTLLGSIGREVQHPDHLHNFSFKILNTLCLRAGFQDWEIIPYQFYATEMILQTRGIKRLMVIIVERSIRTVERFFPLLSFGYIVRIKI